VNAFDFRGHGNSTSPKEPTFSQLMVISYLIGSNDEDDLETIVGISQDENVPLFLYGFSNGSTILMHHILRQPNGVRGVILVSPVIAPSKRGILNKIQVQINLKSSNKDRDL
jgi:alpha-beta hydrolase superfamily lysophospholipase